LGLFQNEEGVMAGLFCARRWGVVLFAWLSMAGVAMAAEDGAAEAKKAKLPVIADEPKTIDPATLVPEKLAARATVDFRAGSLREVVEWLRSQQKIVVLVEESALADAGVSPSEPVSDRLDNAPVYLLLNRLRSLGLAWYVEDDILHITSKDAAEDRRVTLPYNVGDLLDADYDGECLVTLIESVVDAETWSSIGGEGTLSMLGDVLFVHQTDALQREVQGLLVAIRKHGRRTFAPDPAEHLALRQKLEEEVSVAFADTPLETAVEQLGKDAGIDMRLDLPVLREKHVRPREPVTLKLTDRKLKTVLQAMLSNLKLTWILRDGVLWIAGPEESKDFDKTAVYDVRDLCRDGDESEALEHAIVSGTGSEQWADNGGSAAIEFAKPGTLVLRGQEETLTEVLDLLETYRTALRSSKPRQRDVVDPKEVVTRYYRLHDNVARSLETLLPNLVRPTSWQGAGGADVPGQITYAASPPDLFSAQGQLAKAAGKEGVKGAAVVVARAVLIIRQTRAAHDEIAEVIRRIESGDSPVGAAMGGMGGMGGGFGGGFMSVEERSEE
jgi:hypothetical protein